MLERFTQRARRVMVIATEEARDRRHEAVASAHLLMAILRDRDGLGAGILGRLQVNFASLRTDVERVLSEAPASTSHPEPGFSADLKAVLESAFEEQQRHGHTWIGTEHLLLGLLGPRSTMSGVLRAAGADLDDARRTLVQVLADAQERLRANRTPGWRPST